MEVDGVQGGASTGYALFCLGAVLPKYPPRADADA